MNQRFLYKTKIVLLFIMASLMLVACVTDSKTEAETVIETEAQTDRFAVTHSERVNRGRFEVIMDTKTGKEYLLIQRSYGVGLTELTPVDAEEE